MAGMINPNGLTEMWALYIFRKILTCYNERDSNGILTNDILEVLIMKVNFEMEPNELVELFKLCGNIIDKEADRVNTRTELDAKKELAKARNELSQFVIGKTLNDK